MFPISFHCKFCVIFKPVLYSKTMSRNSSYKDAGVDIKAGDETVKRIKGFAKSTFNKDVLSDIGLFGAFFQPDLKEFKEPVLVSSVDGVGTKLKIAFAADRHNTVGQDLVNHCVNDISVCGAKPLFFLDYLACGKLVPAKAAQIIQGFSIACKENGCALIGGETAEMPGLYAENEYDMSGTIVGIVEKSRIINGSSIKKGDILVGYPSNGLHTNGYSLARKVLLSKFKINEKIDDLGTPLSDELLRVHKSYFRLIRYLTDNMRINGFSHVTGGGIIGNTNRVLPDGMRLKIEWENWQMPAIFKLIQETGKIDLEEMRNVFNLGIGLIAIVSPGEKNKIITLSNEINEHPVAIGEVI